MGAKMLVGAYNSQNDVACYYPAVRGNFLAAGLSTYTSKGKHSFGLAWSKAQGKTMKASHLHKDSHSETGSFYDEARIALDKSMHYIISVDDLNIFSGAVKTIQGG